MQVITTARRRLGPVAQAVAPHWFWRRKYRILARLGDARADVRLAREMCDPSRVSLDIGADVGEFTIAMLASSRSVVAFEPRPAQADVLTAMFEAVDAPVRVEAVALSDRDGMTTMRVWESAPGQSTIEAGNSLADAGSAPIQAIEVSMRRLDDLQLSNVGFIKVDVEGHELAVLTGAENTIRRDQPTLLIEAEERHRPNAVASLANFLGELGYSGYFQLDGATLPVEEFDAARYQNPANIGDHGDGWAVRGTYINDFVFLPKGRCASEDR